MVELHPHGIAHGGEAVARRDGKAHFIAGTMPGEVVEATITEDRGSWARASLVKIIEPSLHRQPAPCPHASECGGCQWQFADVAAQRAWKRETVRSQLEHLGRIADPLVHETQVGGPDFGYRNRMDFHVADGRPALMRARSNDLVPLDSCMLLDASLVDVFNSLGDVSGASRITLRSGIRTGDILVIVEGEIPPAAGTWAVPVLHRTSSGDLETIAGDPKLSEIVDETLFTIPFDGFFQNNTNGADVLVSVVRDAVGVTPEDTLLDGFCGVGLFGATVGQDAGRVIGIDSSEAAVHHARANLTRAGVDHRIVTGLFTKDIESLDEYWDVAIVDPPRKGLGATGVEAVTSAMPRRVVYVACDPASLARDARIFEMSGYRFVDATPVDLFPQTYHVETVATFDRSDDTE